MIKAIQNEEYLSGKVTQLEIENSELKQEIDYMNQQIEGSIRNNQELEIYLENCEVS